MASIHKRNGSPCWFAAFMGADGKRKFISTHTTDKESAQTIGNAWAKTAKEGRLGTLTPERARQILEQTISRIVADTGQTLPGANTREFFEGWQKQNKLNLSPGTFANYRGKVESFLVFLKKKADGSLGLITSADIRGFTASVAERATPSTSNNALTVLKIAFHNAVKNGIIEKSPADVVDPMRSQRQERRAFTMDELRKILSLANVEWRTMILTGLYTGLRLSDCAGLRWTNVDLERAEITLATQKTGKVVIVPTAKPLLHHLESLPMGDDPRALLCPGLAGKPAGTLSSQFHAILKSAGMVKNYVETKAGRGQTRNLNDVSFHALRHTATSLLKNAGVSNAVTMDLIGHSSEAVSRNYTHIESATKRAAVDLMPDVTGGQKE